LVLEERFAQGLDQSRYIKTLVVVPLIISFLILVCCLRFDVAVIVHFPPLVSYSIIRTYLADDLYLFFPHTWFT